MSSVEMREAIAAYLLYSISSEASPMADIHRLTVPNASSVAYRLIMKLLEEFDAEKLEGFVREAVEAEE